LSLETRLRETGPRNSGGGGSSSNSAGLAGTGGNFVTFAADATLSNEKVLTAGSSVIIRTDSTAIYIDAQTGGGSSVIYAPTGGNYIAFAADANLSNEKILTAGSSVTVHTDSTAFYINAITSLFSGTAGLAGTGPFYLLHTSGNGTLPQSKRIAAGSSVTTHTDSTTFYINAVTSLFSGSAGLAGTGAFYVTYLADSTLSNEKVLTAGSSVTIRTDATAIYISAQTGGGSTSKATYQLLPQQAKLYANDSSARIDAGSGFWRLLFSPTTQQYGQWMFMLPQDYSSSPYVRIMYGADSTIAVARSISWIVTQWGVSPNQARAGGYYTDTFGGANTVSIALSAGYSSGVVQQLTVPLASIVSLGVGNLVKLRISGSGGAMGNAELLGATLEYTKQ